MTTRRNFLKFLCLTPLTALMDKLPLLSVDNYTPIIVIEKELGQHPYGRAVDFSFKGLYDPNDNVPIFWDPYDYTFEDNNN